MKALLICPGERPAVSLLTTAAPLVTVTIFGKSLVEYWLEHYAGLGATHVRVLAVDRPEQVRARVGDGARWGIKVEVIPVREELTAADARELYRTGDESEWLHAPNDVAVIDHLPDFSQETMCAGYASWFQTLLNWMPMAAASVRIGLREIQPGIWCGLHTRVSPSAKLVAPCWLGDRVSIGPDAIVGPMAILEDKVFIEASAEISHSVIGAETFVGECTEITDSLAVGHTLINWKNDSSVRVPDDFLLCSLSQRQLQLQPAHWLGRLAAVGLVVCTSPVGLLAIVAAKLTAQEAFKICEAVPPQNSDVPAKPIRYYELAYSNRWLRRWPQLWNIADGTFSWVGNRPLTRSQAASLTNDFERLWLSAPVGLISLADVEGCDDSFDDETRAHSSFYAVQANARLDVRILQRALLTSFIRQSASPENSVTDHQSIWKGIENENPTTRKQIAYQRT